MGEGEVVIEIGVARCTYLSVCISVAMSNSGSGSVFASLAGWLVIYKPVLLIFH